MQQPTLVVMAAGMGSRFGGLKQLTPLGPSGQILLDYALFDAHRAGFRRVVFIIRPELQESFESQIGARYQDTMQVDYVYQTLDTLPPFGQVPEGRQKPLGTGHAVYCVKGMVKTPFAVINADDFYGADAFAKIYQHLKTAQRGQYAMVGYHLPNTLSESGTVSRGVCTGDSEGYLQTITERTSIARSADGTITCEAGALAEDTLVSMNLWGFTPDFLDELDGLLLHFLREELPKNPEKAEFYLPFAVDTLIKAGTVRAKLLETSSRWFGVTYPQDKEAVQKALKAMTDAGQYPVAW